MHILSSLSHTWMGRPGIGHGGMTMSVTNPASFAIGTTVSRALDGLPFGRRSGGRAGALTALLNAGALASTAAVVFGTRRRSRKFRLRGPRGRHKLSVDIPVVDKTVAVQLPRF